MLDAPNLSVVGGAALYAAGPDYLSKTTLSGAVVTLAGVPGSPGCVDGSAGVSRFSPATAIAADELFVYTSSACGLRKTSIADFSTTTISSSTSQLRSMAAAGGLLYAITDYQTIFRVDLTTGVLTPWVAVTGGCMGGSLYGIATDGVNVFVTENEYNCSGYESGRSLRKVDIATGTQALVVYNGNLATAPGLTVQAGSVYARADIAICTGRGCEYPTRYGPRLAQINVSTGVTTYIAGASSGYANGTGTDAWFSGLDSITGDGTNLYVADAGNNRIRKIAPGVAWAAGQLPWVNSAAPIYSGEVTTLAGNATPTTIAGTGTAAGFNGTTGITYGVISNVPTAFVGTADTIMKINVSTKASSIVAGSIGHPDRVDGVSGSTSRVASPTDLVTDGHDVFFIQGGVLRRMAIATGAVSTFSAMNMSFASYSHLTIGPDGWLYALSGAVYRINPVTGESSLFASPNGPSCGGADTLGLTADSTTLYLATDDLNCGGYPGKPYVQAFALNTGAFVRNYLIAADTRLINWASGGVAITSVGSQLILAYAGYNGLSYGPNYCWPVQVFSVEKATGNSSVIAGADPLPHGINTTLGCDFPDQDGVGAQAQFAAVSQIASNGINLYLAGSNATNNRVRVISAVKPFGPPRSLTKEQTFGCDCDAGSSTRNQRLVADPVNTATGGLVERFTDLTVSSVGVPIDWTRTYNSLDTLSGPFGPGWAFGYGANLTSNSAGEVVFRDGSGTQTRFSSAAGGYAPVDPAVSATLADVPGGSRTLRMLSGQTMTFDTAGRLLARADERGRGLTFGYVGDVLSTITDGLGQTLTVTWDTGTGAEARIASVASSDGRSVSYAYTVTGGAKRLTGATAVDGKLTKFAYNTAGYLSQITDPLGNLSARSTYNAAGQVISQLDETGAKTTLAYDTATQTTTITDPTGRTRQDVYSGYNLIRQIDGDGNATEIYYSPDNAPALTVDALGQEYLDGYDAHDNLIKRTSPAPQNHVESWTYDAADHLTSYTDPEGNLTGYTYTASGLLQTLTAADGGVTTYTYTTGAGGVPADLVATATDPLNRTTSYAYNTTGDMTSVTTPAGRVTSFTYDAAHRILTSTTPKGEVTTYTYDAAGRVLTTTDPQAGVTTNVYDAAGRLTKTTDAMARWVSYTYDKADRLLQTKYSSGRITKRSYDTAGRVATSTDARGKVTAFTYDTAGRLLTSTDPLGAVTTSAYDALGQLTTVTAPGGGVTTYAYDALGQLISVTDPDGVTQTTTYDALGNVTSSTNEAGGTQTTSYDPLSRVVSSADSDGVSTRYTYDLAGQVTAVATDRSGNEPIPGYVEDRTTFTYDADGNRTGTTEPRGNIPGATAATYTSTIAYDLNGRPVTSTDPLGRAAATTYDALGRPVTVTDPIGKVTTTAYDKIGRITQVTGPAGAITKYAYNANSNLTQVTDPRSRLTKYTYDAAGNTLTSTNPLGRVTAMTYDDAGRLASTTKPSGTATTTVAGDSMLSYTYDTAGRLAGVDYSDTTPDLSYTYTPAGRPDVLSRAADALGDASIDYTYDTAGRPTAVDRTGPRPTTAAYAYTPAGRVTGASWSTGQGVAYAYNTVGQITTVTPSGAANLPAISLGYDAAGRTTTVTRAGTTPTVSTSTYDAAGQLTALNHSAGTAVIADYQLVRDPRGFPTQVTSKLLNPATGAPATATNLYTYDANGWLTSECTPAAGTTCTSASPKTAYTYDTAGVRKSTAVTRLSGTTPQTTTTTYGYDTADQLLTLKVGTTTNTTNTWTTDGQIAATTTAAGTRTYSTNLAGEVATVTLEDNRTIGYSYDPTGNRTARTTDNAIGTTWAWDDLIGLSMRIGEYDTTGDLTTSWLPDPTSSTGATYAATTAGTSSWLLQDPYANTIATLPSTGNITGARTQAVDAFGNPITTATPAGSIGFAGQYKDGATGLYDVRARDYDTRTGQFLSIDPLVDVTRQPYAYGNNNPLVFVDATGNAATDGDSAGTAAALGLLMGLLDIAPRLAPTPGTMVVATQYQTQMTTQNTLAAYGPTYGSLRLLNPAAATFTDGYQEGGFGLAVNRFNPLYRMLENGSSAFGQAENGCMFGAMRSAVHAGADAADVALLAAGGAGGARAIAGRAASSTAALKVPNVLRVGEVNLPAVPKGAAGKPTTSGKGLEYDIPPGTPELHEKVVSVRIMDPVTSGRYHYPKGYAVYMNEAGQSVNPLTGRVVARSDPFAHIPLS